MTEPSTISEAVAACRLVFRTATTVPRLMQQEWAENRLADFNLWAMGAGASNTGKASLDHRLRANPEAHTIVLNLLLMLKILLQKCIDGGHGIGDTPMELSGGELARMKDVEDSLNQLTRLTAAIRKAGTRSRLQKADSSFEPHTPQIRSLCRHLELLILVQPNEHGNSEFRNQQLDPARLSPIQLRLIEANLKRRNRFLYAQQHALKLETGSGDSMSTSRGKSTSGKQKQSLDVGQMAPGLRREKELAMDELHAQSTTTATQVDERIEIPRQIARSVTTAVSVTSSRITYPKSPSLHDHQMLFTCPCCCQSLAVAVGRGNQWKKHLMGDILPYTCIVEDCPQTDTFYMTKETWLNHMDEEHGSTVQWVCHACSQKNTCATFTESADFTAHLEQQHHKGIKPKHIPMLCSSWKRKVPFQIAACPLCCFHSDDQNALLDHTAEHIHSFSLRSLPWAPRVGLEEADEDDDDDDDDDDEEYGPFFAEHPYFDVDSCWSEPSASLLEASRLTTDRESVADSDSGASTYVVYDRQQQQLTEDVLDQIPQAPLGQAGTNDWLDSLTSDEIEPEQRLGWVLGGELQLTSIIGVGATSVVYKALDLNTNVSYAVKALSKSGKDSRQLRQQQIQIALHYRASGHLNVVPLKRICDSVDCLYVVTEFFPEGDLFNSIVEQGNFVGNDSLVKAVFLQILDAVEYCHSHSIRHRGLQPENILVAEGGTIVKLGGFGLASEDETSSEFGCGSVFYMSPECQQENPRPNSSYSTAANDVWALGVILVNLTCGRNPWKRASLEDSTFRAYLKDPFFLQSILPLSTEAVVILSRIFERDPSKRITITELRSLIVDCPGFTTLVVAPEVASSDLHHLLEPPVQELDLLSFSPGSSVVIGGSSNGSS